MALTHLTRAGREALRIKLDLEAALLSCYKNQDHIEDGLRAVVKVLGRLKRVISGNANSLFVRSIIHGYMFDTWSSRKCKDEFLTLSVAWPISTDSYLNLVKGLDLQDEFLSSLLTVSHNEKIRLLKLILNSSQLSTELLADLFIWTTNVLLSQEYCGAVEADNKSRSEELSLLWTGNLKEQRSFRQLFYGSIKIILSRLFIRLVRMNVRTQRKPQSNLDSESPSKREEGPEIALEVVKNLLESAVQMAIGEAGEAIDQDLQNNFERWNILIPGFSELQPGWHDASHASKRRRVEDPRRTIEEILQMRQQQDLALAKKIQSNFTKHQDHTPIAKPLDDHQKAFVQICKTIQRYQVFPESPSRYITRLVSNKPTFEPDDNEAFKGHVAWVESTIQNKSHGWHSCVKLKLQFFAVFEDSSINEAFADLICLCDLHWELCSVLARYLKRYRADATRLTFETFQLGCELLLSVFSKKEQIQCQLRDHLYFASRSICQDVKAPLFGSWDLWMINIETQLVATLNQLVATKGKSCTVPPHTIESLVKISLIAPYQVIAKIVKNAMVNRGQSSILLEVLVNLGQLAWLRTSSLEKTLFVTVIHDTLLSKDKSEETISSQTLGHHNFVEFILKALVKMSNINLLALDPTEFLRDCVDPLFHTIIQGAESLFFNAVVTILMKLYQPEFGSGVIDAEWLSQDIHLKILIRLLQLRTIKSSWSVDRPFSHTGSRTVANRLTKNEQEDGGANCLEDISRICELLVSRLSAHISSTMKGGDSNYTGIDNFLQIVQQHDGLLDLESRLIAVPILLACQKHLHRNIHLPELPKEIWPICRDRLKLLLVAKQTNEQERTVELSEALLNALGLGRMNDDVIGDVVQAIDQVKGRISSGQDYLMQALIPLLYRVLSISSRSEGHRLLCRGIPTMMRSWGRPRDPSFFWEPLNEKPKRSLGPYWDTFTQCKYRSIEKEGKSRQDWNGFTSEEIALIVLVTSELLLRFALEPLTPKSPSVVLKVYHTLVGYDVTVDHLTSVVLSSIKFIQVDWSGAPLDLVLFCFMTISRLSNIVTNEHMNKHFKNRLGPSALDSFPFPVTENEEVWESEYLAFMDQQCDKVEQNERVARSRARDELVLAAMNLSEEIVRRQDDFYRSLDTQKDGVLERSGNNNTGNRGKGRKRNTKRNKRGRGADSGGGDEKVDRSLESQDSYQDDDVTSLDTVVADGMDEGTRAWFNSIMGASSGPTVQGSPKSKIDASFDSTPSELPLPQQTQQQPSTSSTAPPTPEPVLPDLNMDPLAPTTIPLEASVPTGALGIESGDIPTTTTTLASEAVKVVMLSPDQIDCLTLALDYLPVQEQQAVKSRMSRLLESNGNRSTETRTNIP
ncbi:hypothetical protein BGZ46_008767 [Entomortierella lignicola]|nr:hypothetical protein BGZ46_008767 [Entomortierella lignicola]